MTSHSFRPLRLTWLVSDDKSGGVISVAQGCCHQAAAAGHEATLLLLLAPTRKTPESGTFRVESLSARPPYKSTPADLIRWLEKNPQDMLILNGCEEADAAVPYIPAGTRLLYAVHDTAQRYFATALRHEGCFDAIVAVSETVAARFRGQLRTPDKLQVICNGTSFPIPLQDVLSGSRAGDLIFTGGDNPLKGAYDVLALWTKLQGAGFSGRLHWFGHTGERFRRRVEAVAGPERIFLYGHQPRETLFEAARRSKVLLMLSRVEPFGMVTVECMGMGCLPVAWNIATGTKEIVGKDEGLFVPLGDYDGLANRVLDAIDLHNKCFAASTTRIRNEFSETVMWTRYEAALSSLRLKTPAIRPLAGTMPPLYRPPIRAYQWVPGLLRSAVRAAIDTSPRLAYALRDMRGR